MEKITFEEAVRPLMKWLCENENPHTYAIVSGVVAELVEGKEVISTQEYFSRLIMTPKEYAQCLVEEIDEALTYIESKRKVLELSLMSVDGIIVATRMIINGYVSDNGTKEYGKIQRSRNSTLKYFEEVKNEIEKLCQDLM